MTEDQNKRYGQATLSMLIGQTGGDKELWSLGAKQMIAVQSEIISELAAAKDESDCEYKITILRPWHEVKKGGFPTALAAYEYVIEMDEISRDDVLSVKIERVKREQND